MYCKTNLFENVLPLKEPIAHLHHRPKLFVVLLKSQNKKTKATVRSKMALFKRAWQTLKVLACPFPSTSKQKKNGAWKGATKCLCTVKPRNLLILGPSKILPQISKSADYVLLYVVNGTKWCITER